MDKNGPLHRKDYSNISKLKIVSLFGFLDHI